MNSFQTTININSTVSNLICNHKNRLYRTEKYRFIKLTAHYYVFDILNKIIFLCIYLYFLKACCTLNKSPYETDHGCFSMACIVVQVNRSVPKTNELNLVYGTHKREAMIFSVY